MQLIIYYLLYPIIKLLSYLPFWLLYLFSDLLYILMYRIIKYRRKVVADNIALVFPNKDKNERKKIEKNFYKHFADLFVEMIKAFQMSLNLMKKRYVFKNIEILNNLTEQDKNIIIVGGHYANWEWVFSLATVTKAFPIATYLKINNPYFEKLMLKNRQRFGGRLIETKQLRKILAKYEKTNERYILGLLADQSPQLHRSKYWRNFFSNDVPVFIGPEELAKKYNTAFTFINITKVKRGFYEIEFEFITDKPKSYPDYQLTDIFIDRLEKQIAENPQYYLWTHRRFKHMHRKEEVVDRLFKK